MLLLFQAVARPVRAQTPDWLQYTSVKVKATVLDSKTHEPISGASVYLVPQGDTTITDFAVSDVAGKVVMADVATGKYELNAEFIGYNPFKKVYEISRAPGWDLDLGTVWLEESAEQIEASSITAAGNPITIQNDTVIYHASSFTVGENAMLEDLLKKMPGMQVGDDGSVTVNGERVDRITVGGKTFFFDDPSVALKNLPAKIVKRIKVSNQESKTGQLQGINTDIDKETVMDVELKAEYSNGWFGNAKLGGGATLPGKDINPLAEGMKALYSGNVMLSGYGEKDQAVLIANAYNTAEPGTNQAMAGIKGMPEDNFTDLGGLMTAVQAGANYNTSRIKHFETTVSAVYKHGTKDDRRRSARTSFAGDGVDILTEGGSDASGKEDQLTLALEMSKKNGKVLVEFLPKIYLRKSFVNESNFSKTTVGAEDSRPNAFSAASFSDNRQFLSSGYLGVTGKDIGKAGRRVGFNLNYDGGLSSGNETENSVRKLDYTDRNNRSGLDGQVFYYEPFGRRWSFQTMFGWAYSSRVNDRTASNLDGSGNDFYTAFTDKKYNEVTGTLLMQYSNDTSTVQFGIKASAQRDAVKARSLGAAVETGKPRWKWNLSPVVTYSHSVDGSNLSVQYSGGPLQTPASLLLPSLDLSDPVRITAGNIYLRSGFSNNLTAYYDFVNYRTYTFLTAYVQGNIVGNGTVQASWFDENGVRYAVPVNSRKPGMSASALALLNQPFGRNKNFTFSLAGQFLMNRNYSYQSSSRLPGIDLAAFDYQSFMSNFWGDADGDRFYGGQSGFRESLTQSYDWGAGITLSYNRGWFSGKVKGSAENRISRYSLDPKADMNVWNVVFGSELKFSLDKGWEIGNDISYAFYRGYTDGFGSPELRWNMDFAKTVKSVTFGLKLVDILNRTKSLNRIVSAEYVEDVYSNVMGRMALFSVSFNFGKTDSKKNSVVSNALKQLEY